VDFVLSDEQEDFVDAIRDFCDRECGTSDQRERLTDGYREHHNFEIYNQMAELGWLGVTIPEEYGGSGGSMLDACLFMEETSRGLAPIALNSAGSDASARPVSIANHRPALG